MPSLREQIVEIARTLPPAPRVFAELGRLLRNPNSALDEIATLVKRDSTLVAHVIRVGNSAFYGGEQPTGSVEEAVARIGFQEVFRVVGIVASERLVERPLSYYGIEAMDLREHMLRTALACEELAAECGLDAKSAYTAGLMRPIGLLVLDRLAAKYENLAPYHPIHDPDYLTWEGRVFGIPSSEVAAIVLREWSFPSEIVEAVQAQYLLRSEDLSHKLACLVNLASGLVADNGGGLLGETKHWGGGVWKLEALGITSDVLHTAGGRAREAYDEFSRRFVADSPKPKRPAPAPKPGPEPAAHGAPTVDSSNFPLHVRVVQANDEPPVQITSAAPAASPPANLENEVAAAVIPPCDDFTTFMRKYQDMVFSTAARITGNDVQAEDISQEVFVKAYDNFEDLRESPTAGGWLKTVATNLSINHLSRYRNRWRFFSEFRRAGDAGSDSDEAPIEFAAPDTFFSGIDAADRRALVDDALARLPEHQRVPLVLYHFEDMPYDEIARTLRVSLAKVKTDILRARTALAKILSRSAIQNEKLTS